MKTKLVVLILIILTFSCKKSVDDNVGDSDDIIKSRVKEVVNSIFKGCEEVNSTMVVVSHYDSPDFVYLFNGTTLTYGEFSAALTDFYSKLLNQRVTLITEKYALLDKSTVLYTTNCTFLQNFRDGHSTLINPVVMLFVFKKTNGTWRWIYGVESYGPNV